jgi:hypothetical protein
LTQYVLDNSTYKDGTTLMVALEDLARLYAPYFTFALEGDSLTVRHLMFTKTVHPEDSGLRAPRLNYTKTLWEVKYSTKSTAISSATKTVYEPFTTKAADGAVEGLEKVKPMTTEGLSPKPLTALPQSKNGKLYVPLVSFMEALGKVALDEDAYLGIQSVIPDIPKASSRNIYTGWEKITDREMTWADYMDGVLDKTITKGHFWKAFYVGVEKVYTGEGFNGESDPMKEMYVNRIMPYNIYIPNTYNPSIPNKFNFILHGGTGNENAPFERLSDRSLDIETLADKYGYIVLSPNGWTRSPAWFKGPARYSFFKAFEMVCQDYNVDRKKVFLSGNSAGGKGTWDLAIRYPEMFVSISPQAPSATSREISDEQKTLFIEKIGNKPAFFIHGVTDATVPYYSRYVPWVTKWVKDICSNSYFMTIEEGNHSYAYGSGMEAMYVFFDSFLKPADPNHRFETLTLFRAKKEVLLDNTPYKLKHPTSSSDGVTMISLADLEDIYGPDFHAWRIAAYNTDPQKAAHVVTILHNGRSLNIKPGETFLRVDAELYADDIPAGKTDATYVDGTLVKDYVVPTRKLSTAPDEVDGQIFVPAVEIMDLLGRSVVVKEDRP